jgi:hypothetical protein
MKKLLLIPALSILTLAFAYCQAQTQAIKLTADDSFIRKEYSISTTYLSLTNFGEEKTNTHHYEIHIGHNLTPRDIIGIKIATWKLFAPMGIPMQEQLEFDESNFYPGRLRETGIGVTYQRMLWKGLFASLEVLPQLKNYLDDDNNRLRNGFKLYTSYHIGYHLPLFKGRMFVEPQVHCQYWPIDTNTPQAFKLEDDKWNNYFLFEPDLYLGVIFQY